jgi:hypothetical protein
MVLLRKFKTLIDLLSYFKDEQVCREYLAQIRWNGNVQCPHKDCLNDKCFTYSDGIEQDFNDALAIIAGANS